LIINGLISLNGQLRCVFHDLMWWPLLHRDPRRCTFWSPCLPWILQRCCASYVFLFKKFCFWTWI